MHNNAFTSVTLVHSCVMGGELLTLPNFLLHFKAKRTELSLARFEREQILIHNKPSPLYHSFIAV